MTAGRRVAEPAGAPQGAAGGDALPAPGANPAHAVVGQVRGVLARYLLLAFVLLGAVMLAHPRQQQPAPASQPWEYQHEALDIGGGGVLNALARQTLHGTAWLARSSIERQRDVHRLNLFDFLIGPETAEGVGGWRSAHRVALEGATQVALAALVVYGVVLRPARRRWLLALLLVLAATLFVTKPQATLRVAAAPGVQVPNLMLGAVAQVAPASEADKHGPAIGAQERMAARYWDAFVAQPLSRMQTGTTVLAEASPSRKAGVLGYLQRNVGSVNDWALGRHGPERAFIGVSALGYVLPFAVALGALAMLAASAQTMLFVLCLACPFVLPFAVDGPRRRGAIIRYWLLPLLASVGLLAVVSLVSYVVLRAAAALHASDEYVGVLLAGSTWPLVAVLVLRRRALRRRAHRAAAAANQGK